MTFWTCCKYGSLAVEVELRENSFHCCQNLIQYRGSTFRQVPFGILESPAKCEFDKVEDKIAHLPAQPHDDCANNSYKHRQLSNRVVRVHGQFKMMTCQRYQVRI
jgi:hypothetical protein